MDHDDSAAAFIAPELAPLLLNQLRARVQSHVETDSTALAELGRRVRDRRESVGLQVTECVSMTYGDAPISRSTWTRVEAGKGSSASVCAAALVVGLHMGALEPSGTLEPSRTLDASSGLQSQIDAFAIQAALEEHIARRLATHGGFTRSFNHESVAAYSKRALGAALTARRVASSLAREYVHAAEECSVDTLLDLNLASTDGMISFAGMRLYSVLSPLVTDEGGDHVDAPPKTPSEALASGTLAERIALLSPTSLVELRTWVDRRLADEEAQRRQALGIEEPDADS